MNRPPRLRPSPTRIGRWSARHPRGAVGTWLAFVALALALLVLTGSKQLQSGVTGEAARGENMMTQHQVMEPQYEFAYVHSDSLRTSDPSFRGAVARVAASMERTLRRTVTTRISASGHSALIAAPVGVPFSTDALRTSVAASGTGQITAKDRRLEVRGVIRAATGVYPRQLDVSPDEQRTAPSGLH